MAGSGRSRERGNRNQMSDVHMLGAVLYAIDLHRMTKFYSEVLALPITDVDETHVRFSAPTFDLVVLKMPADIAATMTPAAPARRSNTAIKLVFYVANLNVGLRDQVMKRTWTIIGVRDVAQSFKWYQSLFGQTPTEPVHSYFGQLVDSDGTVLLCLHEWAVDSHPSLMNPGDSAPGNGLLLFFRVDDYSSALQRAKTLQPRFDEEPHVNPNTRAEEFSLRDPDGYFVTISASTGDVPSA